MIANTHLLTFIDKNAHACHYRDQLHSFSMHSPSIYTYIIGERERANLVVQLAAIFLYIVYSYIYIYIYYTRRMHGIVGERERSNCVVDMRCIELRINTS